MFLAFLFDCLSLNLCISFSLESYFSLLVLCCFLSFDLTSFSCPVFDYLLFFYATPCLTLKFSASYSQSNSPFAFDATPCLTLNFSASYSQSNSPFSFDATLCLTLNFSASYSQSNSLFVFDATPCLTFKCFVVQTLKFLIVIVVQLMLVSL